MSQQAFFDAVLAGDASTLRALAAQDPSLVHARNAENRTALHVALEHNNTVRELLIELGSPVDACAAAALSDVDTLTGLLDEDPALANDPSTGLAPLGWAAYFGAVDSTRLLLERGGDPTDGALLCAARVNCVPVGRMLIEAGADPNAIDEGNEGNALHAAATLRHTRDATAFVTMLLEQGADVNLATPHGLTALDLVDVCRSWHTAHGTLEHHDYDAMERLLTKHGGRRSRG